MKSKDVIEFFGGPAATGRALGITSQAVSKWGDDVPAPRVKTVKLAMQVEKANRLKQAKREAKKTEQ